ncbi:MAG: DNA polymerase III subunit delta' [Thermodesulfobacteriota bacterium]|nr:MAG: DNA polymerase III subunit delta' [Thermodesulfobacteriota bacterium]
MYFRNITGHAREKEILEKAMRGGRVAHSYLFTGPLGVGKRTLALEFARALNCRAGTIGEEVPCGVCEDCVALGRGSHPNFVDIGPEDKDGVRTESGLIRIGRVRELQAAIRYKSGGGKKVAVIDGADKMEARAANALLKTLEEPPGDSVIVLITPRPETLLPTIISRCQRINFRPLSESVVKDFLRERGVAPGEGASVAARLGAGSISAALKYSEAGVIEKRREIVERLALLDGDDIGGILGLAGELSARGDLADILEFLKTWCRDVTVWSEGNTGLMVNGDLTGFIKKKRAGFRALADSFDMIERARYDVTPPRYANKLLVMESLLLGLARKGALV